MKEKKKYIAFCSRDELRRKGDALVIRARLPKSWYSATKDRLVLAICSSKAKLKEEAQGLELVTVDGGQYLSGTPTNQRGVAHIPKHTLRPHFGEKQEAK